MKCHPRKRTLLMVLLLLTGGAIINVAVAWGCAIWADPPYIPNTWAIASQVVSPNPRRVAHVWVTTTGHSAQYAELWFSDVEEVKEEHLILEFIPHWAGLADRWAKIASSTPIFTSILFDARGWPMLAMSSVMDERQANSRNSYDTGIYVPLEQRDCVKPFPRTLPLRPIWPGFAINTMFYAAILWMLCAAPFALRRRFIIRGRVRRGQCPACAYPVGSSPVCTECGKAVTAILPDNPR